MAKITLTDLTAGYNLATRYNANNTAIEAAIENTLSRDGTAPNDMEVDLNMGGFRVANIGAPVNPTDAVRLQDLVDVAGGGDINVSADWPDITNVPSNIQNIEDLVDPGADRIVFWDDSAGALVYLTLGTGLSTTGTTINASGASSVAWADVTSKPAYITSLALLSDPNADRILFWDDSASNVAHLTVGTGLSLTTTDLTFSHLGIQSLVDPGADRIMFWDDSGGIVQWLTVGSGLSISGTTLTTDGAAAMVTSLGLLADPAADRIVFWDDSETNLKFLQLGTGLSFNTDTLNFASTTGSYTGTLTGVTSGSGSVKYSVTGNQVTLEFPDITGTSNSTAHTITGGPTVIRPTTAQVVLGAITTNNGTDAIGSVVVGADGIITLRNVLSATFAGTSTEGIKNCTITYHKS